MYKNKMKEKILNRKEMATYCLVKENAPETVEMIARCGIDGIMIDVQHTSLTYRDVQDLIRAAEIGGAVPLVRVGSLDEEAILRYLDMGAMGIQVPDIHNAEDAQRAVNAVKFPPVGTRGLSVMRAADYSIGRSMTDFVPLSNQETQLFVMIENQDAIANIDEIMAVEGVDGATIGTTDLSLSLGYPGQPKHPDVLAAIEKIIAGVQRAGKAVGTQMRDGRTAESMRAEGFTFISCSAAAWIKKCAKDTVKAATAV